MLALATYLERHLRERADVAFEAVTVEWREAAVSWKAVSSRICRLSSIESDTNLSCSHR